MSKTYDYYADGSLRFSSDLLNHKMDRFNGYDHAGRIKEAFSGAEARFEPQTNNRPYRETFGYDALGHLTARTNDIWRDSFTIADSYLNNRHPDWSYDADGRLLSGTDSSYTYDATGEIRTVASFVPVSSTTRGLDGAGQQVRTDETAYNEQTQSSTTTTKYYLHSSVLGGQVLTEIDADGAKLRTFVYGGGSVLAWQVQQGAVQRVVWEHRDPSDASFRTTDPSGYPWGHADEEDAAELDPTGGNAGLIAPIVQPGPPPDEANDSLIPYPSWSDPRRPGLTYAVDYVQVTVDYFFQQLDTSSHGSFTVSPQRFPRYFSHYSVDTNDGRFDFRTWGEAARMARNTSLTVIQNWIVSDWSASSLISHPLPDSEPQNTAGKRCDDRLAGIFGGEGSIFATDRDPSTLADPTTRDRNRLLSPGESPVNGHAHLYASPTGAGVAGGNLFTPSGYQTEERAPYTAHQDTFPELQNYHRFTYLPGSLQRFAFSGGLVISFIHSGPTNSSGRPFPATASDKPGSALVGTIGNFGGIDVGGSDPGYVHTHIRFYSADRRGQRGAPIDPRAVFCHDLGF
jgi:hypothetical protein